MDYYDIEISFSFECYLNKNFIVELVKMAIRDDNSTELLLWVVYNTSSTYVKLACSVNKDTFNKNTFENHLEIVFSSFYNNVMIKIYCVDLQFLLSKLIFIDDNKTNRNDIKKDHS